MWPMCKLHFYVFMTVHDDQSVVAFAPSFLWPREPRSCYVIGPQLDHVQLNWSRQIRLHESRSPWPGQLHKSYKSMEQGHWLAVTVAEAQAGALLTCHNTDCIRIYRIIWTVNEFVLSKANSHLFLPIPLNRICTTLTKTTKLQNTQIT